jgi:hypothetical protein
VPSRLLAVTFAAHDPALLGRFWAALLGRAAVAGDGVLLPGDETQVGLRFVPGQVRRNGLNRLHLHLTSASPGDQERTVATALGLGANHLDVGQRPEEGHVVLADPEGNELCVIEHGNAYLAGCGLLGEVACEGSREVGLFWSAALGWPLVWDRDGETAIQSPRGGTKVAWGGPPVTATETGQRFDLVADDVAAEAERLVSLGATRLASGGDGEVVLADPDGFAFTVGAAGT